MAKGASTKKTHPAKYWAAYGLGFLALAGVEASYGLINHGSAPDGGVYLTICLIAVVVCAYKWWKTVRHPLIVSGEARRTIKQAWICVGAVVIVVGFVGFGNPNGLPMWSFLLFMGGSAWLVLPVLVVWANRSGQAIIDGAQAAGTPLPTPGAIAAQLRQQLGREPTLEEIAAMTQIHAAHRNQTITTGVIAAGLLYETKKHLQ